MRGCLLPKMLPPFATVTISLLFLFSINLNAFAQINFDSVKTVVSSALYDYRNPVFDNQNGVLFQTTWLSYERYKANGASDIVIRPVTYNGYGGEIVLTSAVNDSNINPCILDKFIFWESNKEGNWNIYYSYYSGTWSAPVLLPGSTSMNETQPSISYNYTGPVQFSYYTLVFKRGADIFLKKYIPATSAWDTTEYNVTDSISENCAGPVINYEGGQQFTIAFFKDSSPANVKLNLRRFTLFNNGVVSWLNRYEFNANVELQKMKSVTSYGSAYPRITFDTGSANKSVMILNSSSSPGMSILTSPVSGSNSSGKAVTMGIITDNLAPYFSVFGCISKRNDSTFMALQKQYDAGSSSNNLKRKYIGNALVNVKWDLSLPHNIGNSYKIRAVWERTINGKFALEESFMTDPIGGVSYLGEATGYSLSQNYPNPFNPSTRINYELKQSGFTTLKVFDLLGKEVASLVNEKQNAGRYAVDFNSLGYNIPSGIYFYTMTAGDFKEIKKMMLVK